MSNASQNDVINQINTLFEKVELECHKYKWENAIQILKKAKKISEEFNLNEIQGQIYYRLGEIHHIAVDYQKTKGEVLSHFQSSISNFEKALLIFKELKNDEKINATLGCIELLNYISGFGEGKEANLESAKNYLHQAKLKFNQMGNKVDSLKMAILEARALNLFIGEKSIRITSIDYKNSALEFKNVITEIADELIKRPDFSEIYFYYFLIDITEFSLGLIFSIPIEEMIRRQYLKEFINIVRNCIDKTKNIPKNLLQFGQYTVYSFLNTVVGAFTEVNQFEQKKYIKTAEHWLKKGETLLERPDLPLPTPGLTLFYLMRFANAILLIALGFFARDFKRVMKNLDIYQFKLLPIHYPKITITIAIIYSMLILTLGAVNLSAPDISRIDFAKRALELNLLLKNTIATNQDYKIYIPVTSIFSGLANAELAELIEKETENVKYYQIAAKIFEDLINYDFKKLEKTQIYTFHLNHSARTAILLAKNALTQSKKINYYQKAIDFLTKTEIGGFYRFYIENLFLLGDVYFDLAILSNDDKILKKSSSAYFDAIEFCKDRGYHNLVGSGYVNLAKIEDRLGNYHSAADHYNNAIDAFNNAILTLTYSKLGKKIEKLSNYMQAWQLIESAKAYHVEEDHLNAQLNYEKASQILSNLREYRFESPIYSGWALLQKAEHLSKQNKHEEAAATYLVSKNEFQNAKETLNSYLEKKKIQEDTDRISKLIEVAKVREIYCTARHQIETARLESKKGNHSVAADLYSKASSLFEKLCETVSLKREKDELMAIFYLCKAWENMEKADLEQKASIYALASELFQKASNTFYESRMRKFALGNSLYCLALESGSLFDKTTDLEEKTGYYKKIKVYLRESSRNYQLSGFEQDAQWVLATAAFFDGIWHLIQSDYEIDHSKKNQYLSISTNYLNNALTIFGKAGYKEKREEILKYLKMIKDEKAILTSALNLIEKPEIASSVGISAPSYPIEISSSVNIDEMQRTDLQTEAELNWHKRIQDIYIFMPKSGTCIFDHSFKAKEDVEPQLISGGLAGISMLIQELTKNKTKVRIVEQEEMTILLEHGKYLSVALITEENLITLRNKLKELIQDVEDFYAEELETYIGDISRFPKINKFVQKIFEP